MRAGAQVLETIDSVRLGHVVAFASTAGIECPILTWLAGHPDGSEPLDWEGLVEEMQRLAIARPPERTAPLLGLLRNDATRCARMAAAREAA